MEDTYRNYNRIFNKSAEWIMEFAIDQLKW